MSQSIKNPPVMKEMRVRSRSQEDPLKKEMATHSSILAWRIPWMEEPGRPQCLRSQESNTVVVTKLPSSSMKNTPLNS